MNINTKEKYDKLKKPLIPKSITRKKKKRKLVETFKPISFKAKKLIPFIPKKDKTNKPFTSWFKINPSMIGLNFAFDNPRLGTISYRGASTKAGLIKHIRDIRQIKKLQRRRRYLKALRG